MNSLIALATAIALTLLAGAAFATLNSSHQQAAAIELSQQLRATPVKFQHAANAEGGKAAETAVGRFATPPAAEIDWQPRAQQRFTF